MKYTVEFYGWEMEAVGHTLTNEQVDEIKNLMKIMVMTNFMNVDLIWKMRELLTIYIIPTYFIYQNHFITTDYMRL